MSTATATRPLTFADASDPERSERLAPLSPAAPVRADRVPTPELRERLLAGLWREKAEPPPGRFRAARVAKETGFADAYLSFYVNWQEGTALTFDVPRFEVALEEFFAGLDTPRDAAAQSLFPTPVSEDVIAFAQQIRAAGSVGVYHGDAGLGKSCGLRLLPAKLPRALVITCTAFLRGGEALTKELFRRLGLHEGKKKDTRARRVAETLRSRPRLLVFDNAQRLNDSAFRLLFDIHDQTEDAEHRTSLVFVGNPEIIERLESNDQFASRVGRTLDGNGAFSRAAGGDGKADSGRIRRVCQELVKLHLPDADPAPLVKLAAQVASVPGGGRFRSVVRRLQMVRDLTKTEAFKGQEEKAFRGAHATLFCREKFDLSA